MKTDVVTSQSITQRITTRVLAGVFVVTGLTFLAAAVLVTPPSHEPKKTDVTTSAVQLNHRFSLAVATYAQAKTFEQSGAELHLRQIAQQRHSAMEKLMHTNPNLFLQLAVAPTQRQELPTTVQPFVEQQATLTGRLVNIIQENFAPNSSSEQYVLVNGDIGQRTYTPVYLADELKPGTLGSQVNVTGYQASNDIVTDSTSITSIAPSTIITTGTRKVAVILFNFQDNPSNRPITVDQARATIFTDPTSVNAFYQETSHNQLSLVGKNRVDGDVYGWITIPYNGIGAPCDDTPWENAAAKIIGASALNGYDNYIYYFPYQSSCGSRASAEMPGDELWLNGDLTTVVAAHEFGHNLGANHAGGNDPSDYTKFTYGDPFDVMGNRAYCGGDITHAWCVPNSCTNGEQCIVLGTPHYSGIRQAQFGWLAGSDIMDITGSGVQIIQPLGVSGTGHKLLRIMQNTFNNGVPYFYYLDYRQPGSIFEHFLSTDPVTHGVSIRTASVYELNQQTTHLLETNPATPTYEDAPLGVGQTFTDSARGIAMTTTNAGPAGATVSVTLTCDGVRRSPSYSPTYYYYNSHTQSLFFTPGQSRTVPLRFVNNDQAGCAPRQFTVTANLPSGWTMQPVPVKTLTPNVLTQIPVIITPPATATDGYYPTSITVTSTDGSGTTVTGNDSFGIDQTPPQFSLTSPLNQSTLPRTGMVTIGGSFGSGLSSIALAIDGTVYRCLLGLQTCPLTLTYPTWTFSWDVHRLTFGTHTIVVTETDTAGNSSAQSIVVNYPYSRTGGSSGPIKITPE